MPAETLFPAAATLIALLLLSALASLFIPKGMRLPMQWDLRGKPTWTAPATMALLFTPFFVALVFAVTLLVGGSRPGIAGILFFQAVIFVLVHALHLVFATWHVVSRRHKG